MEKFLLNPVTLNPSMQKELLQRKYQQLKGKGR